MVDFHSAKSQWRFLRRLFETNAAGSMPDQLSQLLHCLRWIGTLLVLCVHGSILFCGAPPQSRRH